MIARSAVFIWALCSCIGLAACDPGDACDRGYRADHGYCYLRDGGYDNLTDAQLGGGDNDSGEPTGNPNAKFGMSCTQQSDCGGIAPVCGGPMLPICTDINCLATGRDTCPTGWQCIDVTKYMESAAGVSSVCINL
jgi:hypothetical protein